MFPYITQVNVKALEVIYNALVSAVSAPELDKHNTNSHYNVCMSIIQP